VARRESHERKNATDGTLGAELAAAQAYQASDGASPDNPGRGTLGNGANGQ